MMIDRKQHATDLLAFDQQFKANGLVVAGMDEVGRGPLAGNVVTACVVMPEEPILAWIDDSKKLSESRREKVYEEILRHALYIGIGEVSPAEIDEINILQATRKAMRAAAAGIPADIFLIDAVTGLGLKGKEVPDESEMKCRCAGGKTITFASEKVLLEEYADGNISEKDFEDAIHSAGVHFIMDKNDIIPYRKFMSAFHKIRKDKQND